MEQFQRKTMKIDFLQKYFNDLYFLTKKISQEELPAEMLKKFKTPAAGTSLSTTVAQIPSSNMKPAVVSTPEDKKPKPRNSQSSERPGWLSAGIPGAIPTGI